MHYKATKGFIHLFINRFVLQSRWYRSLSLAIILPRNFFLSIGFLFPLLLILNFISWFVQKKRKKGSKRGKKTWRNLICKSIAYTSNTVPSICFYSVCFCLYFLHLSKCEIRLRVMTRKMRKETISVKKNSIMDRLSKLSAVIIQSCFDLCMHCIREHHLPLQTLMKGRRQKLCTLANKINKQVFNATTMTTTTTENNNNE